MDVVELPIPAVVAVSKLIGSEASFGGTGSRLLKEGVAVRDTDRNSAVAMSLMERCSSLASHRDATSVLNSPESATLGSIPTESFRYLNEAINSLGGDGFDQLNYRTLDRSLLSDSIPESVQLQQKPGKVSRSVSGRSKRPRIARIDDVFNQGGHNNVDGVFESVGSDLTNCELPGKAQLVRQKSNLNGKRSDRRNLKFSSKSKCDAFSVKAGLASTSAAGGITIFGLYGLRSDNPDVTKHLDELSLDELLDESYKAPSSSKDKAKRPANGNEKFLRTITRACSVLELRKPVKSQMFSEVDSSSTRIMSPYPLSTASCVPSSNSSDKEDINMTDASVHNKDFSYKPEAPPNILDFSLLQPQDVYNCLALPPPKDLESLLLDAAKPASISRNDSRSGKQTTTNRDGLPPFPWSHIYSGHLKTNSDAAKLSSTRATCQGRWARIDGSCSLLGVVNESFTDLDSLTYDHGLVPPFTELISGVVGYETSSSPHASLLRNEAGEPAPGLLSSEASLPTVEEYSATSLAAAEILVDLATLSLSHPHNPSEMTKSLTEPSTKLMGTRRLKFIEKPKDFLEAPKLTSYNTLPKKRSKSMPSKKPKLSNPLVDIKSPINWVAPKSYRSSPSRLIRELKPEAKHRDANNVKQQSCMLTPAAKVSEKRKVIQIDWNRTRENKS